MKISFIIPFIATLSLSTFICRAQREVSEFGAFTAEEIYLKQCDFDKEADAVVLLDKATSNYNDQHNLITERRIRFKILKERGIDRGNIHINYYSDDDFEVISNIEATVLNIDAENKQVWSNLDRKSIYNKKLNRYNSQVSFALPNIKVGSIIEYRYQSQMKHYGGLREWTFQSEMPVLLSSYYLTIVPNAEFAYRVYKADNLHIDVKPDKQNGGVLFEMQNIPGLREEAYIGAARDYLQRVKFQFSGYRQGEAGGYGTGSSTTTRYTTTWKELANELLDESDFGGSINKTLPVGDLMLAEWNSKTDPFEKMRTIHNYVRTNFNWDHIYSKYVDGGLKSIWEKKSGTTGDINLILINLLKASGLQVQPLLVSDRNFGKIDTTYPFKDQFLKVVAYVTIDNKHYILDGTDKETPSSTIPFDLLNTTGFIVDKKKSALLKITDKVKKNSNIITFIGTVDNRGTMKVEAGIDYYDYAKIEKKEKYNRDKKKYEKELFEPYSFTTLDSLSITGIDADSLPLHNDTKLVYNLNKTGDYFLLNYNLFTGLNKNPFIREQRFSDINFGCEYSYVLQGGFTLPDNLTPEALPKNIRMVTPDKSMTLIREVKQTNNTIQIGISINFSQTEYGPDEYPEVQAFYKQMVELLNEPIVLKQKA